MGPCLVNTTKNSWFTYRLLRKDFYPYINLGLHTNFIYVFITYRFYIRIHCIQILYTLLLFLILLLIIIIIIVINNNYINIIINNKNK